MPAAYGSVTVEEERNGAVREGLSLRTRVVVSIAFGVLAFCAVFAWGNGVTAEEAMKSAVDYNKIREDNAQIPGIAEMCKQVTKPPKEGEAEMRFALFGFNTDTETRNGRETHDPEKDYFVPFMKMKATGVWERDWEMFKNALPENDVAIGVYKFPIWSQKEAIDQADQNDDAEEAGSDDKDTFTVMNLIITWSPKDVNPRELIRGGFFLPRVLVACEEQMGESFGASNHIALTDKDLDYYDVCKTLVDDPELCETEKKFIDCPFFADGEGTPCSVEFCEGADFSTDQGSLPEACCDYIKHQYCPFHENAPGCNDMTKDIIDDVCSVYDDSRFADEDNVEFLEFNQCGPVIGKGGIMVRFYSNELCKCVFDNDNCFKQGQCKRDQSCVLQNVMTYKNCHAEKCRSYCNQLPNPTDSSQFCSGCPPLEDGYKCYAGATGYKEFECCGVNPICTAGHNLLDEQKCKTFSDTMGCAWGTPDHCTEINAQQKRVMEVTTILDTNAYDKCQFALDDWDGDETAGTCEDLAAFKEIRSKMDATIFADGDRCACCEACMGAEDYCTTECASESTE